jgi:hypothetical protein
MSPQKHQSTTSDDDEDPKGKGRRKRSQGTPSKSPKIPSAEKKKISARAKPSGKISPTKKKIAISLKKSAAESSTKRSGGKPPTAAKVPNRKGSRGKVPIKKPFKEPIAVKRTKKTPEPKVSWESGETAVSHLSAEQLSRLAGLRNGRRLHAGARKPRRLQARAAISGAGPNLSLARPRDPIVDWRIRNGGILTPVKSQDVNGTLCNACVAFGTIAVIESRVIRLRSVPPSTIDFSEGDLFRGGGGNCVNGWNTESALDFCQNEGVIAERQYPYRLPLPPWPPSGRMALAKLRSTCTVAGIEERKQFLSQRGPLIGGMVLNDEFKNYTGGVYRTRISNRVGDHVIAVVGYNDSQGYWICKNSWGTSWGELGFFNIAYGECGIDSEFPFYDVVLSEEQSLGSEDRNTLQKLLDAANRDESLRNCLVAQVCGVDGVECDGSHPDEVEQARSIVDPDAGLKKWFCEQF